jgi:hypothetical protein
MYSQAFNRYAYVYNNPLSMTDPSGFAVTCSTKPCDKCIETCVPTPDPPPDAPPAMQPLPDVPPPARTSPVPVPSLSNVTDPNTGTHIPGVDTGCLGCSAGSFGGGNFVYGSGHVGIYGGAGKSASSSASTGTNNASTGTGGSSANDGIVYPPGTAILGKIEVTCPPALEACMNAVSGEMAALMQNYFLTQPQSSYLDRVAKDFKDSNKALGYATPLGVALRLAGGYHTSQAISTVINTPGPLAAVWNAATGQASDGAAWMLADGVYVGTLSALSLNAVGEGGLLIGSLIDQVPLGNGVVLQDAYSGNADGIFDPPPPGH